jgi:segregation and condensation protein B
MTLDAQIESILFWKGEPMSLKKLAVMLDKSEEEISTGIVELEKKLEGRGLQLIKKENEIMMGTHADMSPVIEKLIKEELVRDLGKAGLETLSIILYRGPVTRRDIDYIRGVNSNFIVRNLLVRGLVEKIQNPDDQRAFFYKPTFQLLSYLGVGAIEELPEYATVREEIKAVEEAEHREPSEDAAQ